MGPFYLFIHLSRENTFLVHSTMGGCYDDIVNKKFNMLVLQDYSWIDLKEKKSIFMDLELRQSCKDFN